MMVHAAKEQPDLVVLPESPWFMFLDETKKRNEFWFFRDCYEAFRGYAVEQGCYVVTGCATWVDTPYDVLAPMRRYNSAMVFNPQGGPHQRYDKVHLVYFGEIVPFRFGRFRFLYLWINSLMPFGAEGNEEFSFFKGKEFKRFTMAASSLNNERFEYGIPICYEDVMPYVARTFTSGEDGKRAQFLLNISNDGWFGRGIQQPQHLAISVFRAVENRVGIARAVNTGVSAIIDPDGRVRVRVDGDPNTPWPGKSGYAVSRLKVDSRYTWYTQYGDWFAWTCAALWLLFYLDYFFVRATTKYEHEVI